MDMESGASRDPAHQLAYHSIPGVECYMEVSDCHYMSHGVLMSLSFSALQMSTYCDKPKLLIINTEE